MDSRHERVHRIILVSELFYPEESATAHILTKIAGQLSRDFEIQVLTGPAYYEGRAHQSLSRPPLEEDRIERLWAPNLSKNNLFGRLFRFLLMSFGLGWKTLVRSRRSDTVFAVTNPAPLLVVLALVRKLRRFSLVFLVHDVFPENAVAAGIIRQNHILYPHIKRIFDWAYRSADAVITIGRDMSEVLSRKNPSGVDKITLIENWADHPLVEQIPREKSMIVPMGLSEKIVIQYAGNIGRAQGLLEFVDLISAVENDGVQYVFRGSGALSTAFREATIRRKDFTIAGSYPRCEQSQVLGACDISLVILASKMYGLGVPSKTYNILASGKPVLYLGPKDSEIYRLVKTHDIGWAFDWSETCAMLKLIGSWSIRDLPVIEARGNNARKLAETSFSEAGQLAKFTSLFYSIQGSAK